MYNRSLTAGSFCQLFLLKVTGKISVSFNLLQLLSSNDPVTDFTKLLPLFLYCNLKGKTWLFSSFMGVINAAALGFTPSTAIRATALDPLWGGGYSTPGPHLNLAIMTGSHCIQHHSNPPHRFFEYVSY